jgi:hypothetical protein
MQSQNPPEIRADQKDETATLRFGRTLEVGTHVLGIEYQGQISERSEGLFVSRYGTPGDPKRVLATIRARQRATLSAVLG